MPDTARGRRFEPWTACATATPEPLTCSVGVAQWDGSETAEDADLRADRGLYLPPRSLGRDRGGARAPPAGTAPQTQAERTLAPEPQSPASTMSSRWISSARPGAPSTASISRDWRPMSCAALSAL